jgi:hypothetical protein
VSRCIYCQEEKSAGAFQHAEHVLPKSFGTFQNNFTLSIVCDSCNQHFGDSIELALARDSVEGNSRFGYGVKNPQEFRPFGRNSRIIFRVGEGRYSGAYAYREYCPRTDGVVLRPFPQVGFLMAASGKYEYFLLDEIPTEQELREKGFDSGNAAAITGLVMDEGQLRDKLSEKGITFRYGGEILPQQGSESILCELEVTVDQTIFRAITKIAFNYLAYWQGESFVNESAFDLVRRYIRYGEKPDYKLVEIRQEAILADEPVVGERRLGHLITVNWASDGVSMVSQVSLFNWVTYCVSLARDYPGERRDVRKGNFFDTTSREILDLGVR